MKTRFSCKTMNPRAGLSRYAGLYVLTLLLIGTTMGCPRKDTTPPGNVSALSALPGDGKIDLSWANPGDSDLAGVQIQRKTGSAPTGPTDGTTAFKGAGSSYSDTGLSNGTAYYYGAYAYDTSNNFASGTQAVATPTSVSARAEVLQEYQDVRTALSGDPGGQLPVNEVGILIGLLETSEADYRAGNPCVAADELLQFTEAAQGYRQGAGGKLIVQGGFEALHNLGWSLRYEMLAGLSAENRCPGTERVGAVADAGMDDTASDNARLKTDVLFGAPKLVTVKNGEDVYTLVEIPGANTPGGAPGAPAVPVLRRLFAVPEGAQASVEVSSEPGDSIQMNLIPFQDLGRAQAPGTPPPFDVFQDRVPFTKNPDIYGGQEPYPAFPATITPVGRQRDLTLYQLEVPAGAYDPASQTLALRKNVTVDVSFSGGKGTFTTDRSLSPFETLGNVGIAPLLNGSLIKEFADVVAQQWEHAGEEYMILTHPTFKAAADKLAEWKNKKGIVTKVYVVNDPAGEGKHSAVEIKEWMRQHYHSAKMRPSYALLLGDAEFLPPFYVQSNLDPGATICSDWPYSNLPPDGLLGIFDIFQDVALGRIPVDTLDEANLVVDKIINYEKTPPLQHGFYQKATVASQFQCCRTDVDWAHRGSDQAAFVEPSEVCRDAMVNAGYAVDRIYAKTVDGGDPSASPPIPGYTGDATPRFYWDGTAIPADIGPGSGFAWDGDATDVVNAWNEGRFLMIHVDHGYPGGWGTPGFNWNQVTYDLNSSNLTPVLFSINCSSGYYDNEIVGEAADYSQMYFTERLLRFPGRAVAVFSSSRTSWIWENSFQIKGWIDALFPNTLPGFGDGASHHRLGDIFVHGDIYMLSQINVSFDAAHAGDQIHMYHLFGDPTMEIWTKYPYTFQFPSNIGLTIVNGVLDVNYAADGAVVTAFGHSLQGERIPVGRGSIEGGHATLFIENPPRDGELLDISVGLPDAISTELQVQVPDITPPAGVYRFFRHRVESGYQLTWINPADSDFAGVRIQRKVGSYPLSVDDGENVFEGNGESLMDDGYVAGVPDYYYTAFAHDAVPNYAPGVNAEIGQ